MSHYRQLRRQHQQGPSCSPGQMWYSWPGPGREWGWWSCSWEDKLICWGMGSLRWAESLWWWTLVCWPIQRTTAGSSSRLRWSRRRRHTTRRVWRSVYWRQCRPSRGWWRIGGTPWRRPFPPCWLMSLDTLNMLTGCYEVGIYRTLMGPILNNLIKLNTSILYTEN